MSDFVVVDENLRAAMRFFGEATGSGDLTHLTGVLGVFSGLDYGVFNIALLEEPVGLNASLLKERILEAGRFFKSRTLRWSFWLCENLLDVQTRRRTQQIFAEFGLRAISNPPGMLAPALSPPVRSLPSIECRPVIDAQSRQAFAHITSVAFEIPFTITQAVYTPERAWQGSYQGYVGLLDGKPVSIVALVAAGGALGVYSLGTLPSFRHQGYGEALLRAAIAQVQQQTGMEPLVLQSTEAGYDLYRRLGFRDVTRYGVYLTK